MNNAFDLDEGKILLRLKRGDMDAFESIYARYAQKLTIKLIQLLKSEEIVQDVLQDVFLKIWENRERALIRIFHSMLIFIKLQRTYL